ncbi:SDR family oxidoreductase [Streptomyces geranii]|uniref:SDR family oxidoreductase n=1 Tax=Streptomyces geranii TaxID=2058923 RepID=UPI001E3CEBF0|nr:SDR family oxidoreductase [Streptomyces geranii]
MRGARPLVHRRPEADAGQRQHLGHALGDRARPERPDALDVGGRAVPLAAVGAGPQGVRARGGRQLPRREGPVARELRRPVPALTIAFTGRCGASRPGPSAGTPPLRAPWAARAQRGSVDVVVANAGRGEQATLAEATPEHFDRIFSVNARGAFFTVQKALPLLNDNGSITQDDPDAVGSSSSAPPA